YFLSPARGQAAGEGIEAVYPAFQITAPPGGGKVAAGTKATNIDGGRTFHQIAESFVFAGAYVSATGLKSPITIEVHADDVPIHSLILLPDAEKKASGVRYFDPAREQAKVSFKLATDAEFEEGGGLYFEAAELLALKASVQDVYLVVRLASTHGGDGANLDEDGLDLPDPHVISDTYFRTGCIVNGGTSGLATIGENSIVNNPIHEALRQLIVDNARLAQKDNLVGYEVVNGKSVLYYKRYAYGLNNEAFDIFAGLGPSSDPVSSGQINPGYRYLVKTGSVIYDGKTIAANQTFVGKLNVKSFEALNNALVFKYDGIRLTAPQQGTSNRWVLFFSLNGYRPVESSIWKEELYDNTIVLHQRGHTLTKELYGHTPFPPKRDLNAHFTLGQKHALISEAPSGYIYAKGINGRRQLEREAQKDFYRSCQIYQAPYEIESIVAHSDDGVKVTIKGRLRHTSNAPVVIRNDPETWGFLDHEKYRTDENAAMDYLRYRAQGKHCKESSETYVATDGEGNPVIDPETGEPVKISYPFQVGDLAANNNVDVFGSDRPKGCCLPRSYFVRMIPEVHEDNNPDQDTADTGVGVEPYCLMEFYLRAFCNGFVDEKASLDLCDTDSPLMDYTFQNLCFDAIGQKWLDILPEKLKPSAFGGHGPLPRTQMYAEVFNNFSQCINKLDKVRIDLPLAVQSRLAQFSLGLQPFLPAYGDLPPDGPCACPPSGPFNVCDSSIGIYGFASAPLRPPTSNWRDLCAEGTHCEWADGFGSAYASIDARVLPETAGFGGFGPSLMCEGGEYRFPAVAEKRVGAIRVNPEQDKLLAVPESIRDMLTDERSLGVIGRMVKRRNWTLIDQENGEREQCHGTFWNVRNDAANDFLKIRDLAEMSEECMLLTGSLEKYLPELPESVLTWFNTVNCRKGRGASSSVSFQPVNNPVLFVQVPLLD
ncbi:MAG: hypothetical protein HY735_23500, partial [Verrucomicrobia bacterium]|nr:hypothetical protein [Verrucomicrobiota bacterium]